MPRPGIPRTKRLLLLLLAYAVGGAIINVAVAWGLALSVCVDERGHVVIDSHNSPLQTFTISDAGYLRRIYWSAQKQENASSDEAAVERNWHTWAPLAVKFQSAVISVPWNSCIGSFETSYHAPPPGGMTWDNLPRVEIMDCRGWPAAAACAQIDLGDGKEQPTSHDGLMIESSIGRCHRWLDYRVLPLKPIWPGFVINTMFYAAVLWLLFAAPGFVRRRLRARRGQCPACGYQIAPGTGHVCSECGRPLR
jgi:hypothetical protein